MPAPLGAIRSSRCMLQPGTSCTTGIPMATSNSAPTDTFSASYRVVDTIGEQTRAIDTLLALARSSVRVFDRDLSQGEWNTARRADLLSTFLRTPDARLQIIVHDTRYLEKDCPR